MSATPDDELPTLLERILSESELQALGLALQHLATIDQVLPKARTGEMVLTASIEIKEAIEELIVGRLLGVQVRYHLDGQSWIDTFLRAPSGYRALRMRVGSAGTAV